MLEHDEETGHRRVATVRQIVEIVAIIAAGIWAFYTFIYEEQIKPAHEPLDSVETISLVHEGRIRGLDIIQVKILIQNTGKTEFDMVASNVEVYGYRYGRVQRLTEVYHDLYTDTDSAPTVAQHLIFSRVDLYDGAVNGRAGVHNIVDPGSQTQGSYLIAIPHGRYDLLHAKFQYMPHKTPLRGRFVINVKRLAAGGFQLTSPSNDLLEDNVESQLALTQ